MKRRVTIEDVALAAGVSRQTVSRAINNKAEISPDTHARVMAAVRKLGYRPSRLARGLVTQRTHTIGLVMPDITNPFFPEVARGVQDVARAQDYNVFLCNTDESPLEELQALHSLAVQPVDGIVLCSSRISDDDLAAFVDLYHPLVLVNRIFEHPGVSVIMIDNRRGVQIAIDYLVEQGHHSIGMLAGPRALVGSILRIEAFRETMAARGLPAGDDWIVSESTTVAGGYQATRRLLGRCPELTALFAHNDLMAVGAIHACKELGRRLPDECAIVGFDDLPLAAMVNPAVTSVRVDKYGLGQFAMDRLLAMFEEPETSYPPIYLDVELVVRDSVVQAR